MTLRTFLLSTLALIPIAAPCQTGPVTLPAGTQLPVSIPNHLPMKAGEPIRAELLYPVYADDKLVLPAKTIVTGTVVSLAPDHARRVRARLGGDFTPLDTPIVRFDTIVLPSGASVPITTGTATDGAPIYRLVKPPPRKGGFISQQFQTLEQAAKDRIAVVTGPDKADRFQQFVFSQLPYHPQRIAKATAWTVETDAPVDLPTSTASSPAANSALGISSGLQPTETPSRAKRGFSPAPTSAPHTDPEGPPTWIVQAYLTDAISSATSKAGQPIKAIVAEPILNPDGSVAVPQGSILSGSITSAKPARKLSRAGELRFSFRQLTLPGEEPQSVRASLTGADSATGGDLEMTSEGEVKPKPQDKLVVPLILIALAARPLDRDGGRAHHMLGKDAIASNSLGLAAFIIGTAAQQPNLAAGIGYYGAALSIYQRIFAKGKEVAFAKDTRVVIQTTGTRSAAMKPTTAQP